MDHPPGSSTEPNAGDDLVLFLENRAALIRYATAIVGDVGYAEDIVQDAWARFTTSARGQAIHEPKRFLYRIVRNLALDGRRRRTLETRLFVDDTGETMLQVASDGPSAHAQVEAADELAHVMGAVTSLPDRTRTAFLLHRVEGLTLVEVAAQLGLSKSLVHELVVSALDHCRKARRRG